MLEKRSYRLIDEPMRGMANRRNTWILEAFEVRKRVFLFVLEARPQLFTVPHRRRCVPLALAMIHPTLVARDAMGDWNTVEASGLAPVTLDPVPIRQSD
jgi:hypothetical protein